MTVHRHVAAGSFSELIVPQMFSLCPHCFDIRDTRCRTCPSCHCQMIQDLTVWDVLHRLRQRHQTGLNVLLDEMTR
jgi:hypothetical protein